MSTGPESDDQAVPTLHCRVCEVDVPAGAFCGLCGVNTVPQRGDGPEWLRIKWFGAAPGEHVLRPSLASSLFPQLPPRDRTLFRVVLVLWVLALAAFVLLRLPAGLIAVGAFGLPLLFVIYLRESDADRDLPARTLWLTAALGIALGVGWVLLTGARVAHAYMIPDPPRYRRHRLPDPSSRRRHPLGGAILMLAPVIVVRLLRPRNRESLDGFVIGALGALTFTAAATFSRFAPQFAAGMVSRDRPMAGLMVAAGIRGVAAPLTAAAVGGLIGAALWFHRPPNKAHRHPGYVRMILAMAVLAIYAGLGLADVARLPQLLHLALYLVITVVALITLRLGLQVALLHEAQDEILSDEPMLCPHCNHVVPDMAFCTCCGVATHASSRSSRATRRSARPVRIDTTTDDS